MRMLRSLLLLVLLLPCLPGQAIHTIPLKRARAQLQYRNILRRVRATRLTVNWKEVALVDVVKDLRRRLGLNILIGREMKEQAAEDDVSLSLTRVRAATVMKILAAQHKFVWQNREGIVFVTSQEEAFKRSLVLNLYNVRELLYVAPDFPGPDINLHPSGVTGGRDEDEDVPERETKDPEALLELIRQATGPKLWDVEGTALSISKGTLIVRHSPEVQRKVRRFVYSLRGVF